MKKLYEVRTNCEYVTEIEAENEEAALEAAGKTDVGTWNQAWAPMQAEEAQRGARRSREAR